MISVAFFVGKEITARIEVEYWYVHSWEIIHFTLLVDKVSEYL